MRGRRIWKDRSLLWVGWQEGHYQKGRGYRPWNRNPVLTLPSTVSYDKSRYTTAWRGSAGWTVEGQMSRKSRDEGKDLDCQEGDQWGESRHRRRDQTENAGPDGAIP